MDYNNRMNIYLHVGFKSSYKPVMSVSSARFDQHGFQTQLMRQLSIILCFLHGAKQTWKRVLVLLGPRQHALA